MGVFENFPYTNFHNLNLDWIINKIKEMSTTFDGLDAMIETAVDNALDDAGLETLILNGIADFAAPIINVKAPPAPLVAAKGDGVTDDTAAIAAIIAYAAAGGASVLFPSGAYITEQITLFDNVSMFGVDRYNTRIVLKAGAALYDAVVTGAFENVLIANLTLDGNQINQINNVRALDVIAQKSKITDLILKSAFELAIVDSAGEVEFNSIIFEDGRDTALTLYGMQIKSDVIDFNSLEPFIGGLLMDAQCDRSIFSNIFSSVNVPQFLDASGDYNSFSGFVENAATLKINSGIGNIFDFIPALLEQHRTVQNIIGTDIELAPTNPLKYKTATAIDDFFKKITFKDTSNNPYNVLVENTKTGDIATKSYLAADSQFLTVGKNATGAQFNTINAAIAHAATYANVNERVTILIGSGFYTEQVNLSGIDGIDLIGVGRVIIRYTPGPDDATLRLSRTTYIENLYIWSLTGASGQALRVESGTYVAGTFLDIRNCEFWGQSERAVYLQFRGNLYAEFSNCKFESTTMYPLYARNNNALTATTQILRCRNCEFYTPAPGQKAFILHETVAPSTSSILQVAFPGCRTYGNGISHRDFYDTYLKYIPKTGNIRLEESSIHTIIGADYNKSNVSISHNAYSSPAGVITVPWTNANLYEVTITSCTNSAGADMMATVALNSASDGTFIFDGVTVSDLININFTATPLL